MEQIVLVCKLISMDLRGQQRVERIVSDYIALFLLMETEQRNEPKDDRDSLSAEIEMSGGTKPHVLLKN